MNLLKKSALLLTAILLCGGMAVGANADNDYYPLDDSENYGTQEETPKHEFRGAWVATVYGIDWPSRTGTGSAVVEAQKKELLKIFDILQEANLNAVFFQVRSMSDAMYASSYEPWSAYLTGTRGTDPGWDPLAFAVEEAHKRGMELHAWVNPFRLANGAVPEPAKAAVGNATFNPKGKGWTITYNQGGTPAKKVVKKGKNGKRRTVTTGGGGGKAVSVLDPGNAGAREHIVDVCEEIITKYDVDGLVFDDYFYPDRLPLGGGYDFEEWQKATASGALKGMSQADWRRHNVGLVVKGVYEMVQKQKPWVRFGISPAGVAGGNGEASSRYGIDPPEAGKDWMYDRIYCDPLSWLEGGWVDYVSPQVYWASTHETNPYVPIVEWWGDVALKFDRHVYPSQKVLALDASEAAWKEQELQVNTNRENSLPSAAGSVFYSTAHISGKKASGLAEYLHSGVYANEALLPPMGWKEAKNPGKVRGLSRRGDMLSWQSTNNMRYVVYAIPQEVDPLDAISETGKNFAPQYILGVTYGHEMQIPPGRLKGYWFAVAPYDRFGNEWEAAILE